MLRRCRRWLLRVGAVAATAALILAIATWQSLMPLPPALPTDAAGAGATHFTAADGTLLNVSFRGRFNRTTTLPLARMPLLLRQAFIIAEDQRYWQHGGIDWRARLAALWSNLRAGQVVRGASTIAEQAARIIAPRARNYWGKWVAGFDARRLLRRFGHADVLAFYLNQVPYGAQRRGVAQAAHYYFGREPGALNPAEQLALAVLVRSPSAHDPRRHPQRLRRKVDRLARRMQQQHVISEQTATAVRRSPIRPGRRPLTVEAGPFVVHARQQARLRGLSAPVLRTTLDPVLQEFVQQTLRRRTQALATQGVGDAAALVVDNTNGAVLAWAVAPGHGAYAIDPVITPRQPGSALKPFVYGLAMARLGWQPTHVLQDTPLAERIATGVHRYRNYSGRHYGLVSLRYALANSLNVPAVRTAQAVGVPAIIELLQALGFTTFRRSAAHYGPAIVLGDGAVSLYDLVQGYASIARRGQFLPLRVLADAVQPEPKPVLPPAVASLLADILADAEARSAEFGADSVLELPRPTAVKTGTSSDYHDIWTVGFDDKYTVGVWMGNLDGSATNGLTGSMGPAPVLRRIFARLRSTAPYPGLWRSPELEAASACEWIGPPPCVQRREWLLPALAATPTDDSDARPRPNIARPLPGEMLAIDPRLPRNAQHLRLRLDAAGLEVRKVRWQVDGKPLAISDNGAARWMLQPGTHHVSARVWLRGHDTALRLGPITFTVAGPASAPN